MDQLEHAFNSSIFPCNSKPFLSRIEEILDQANTNSLQNLTGDDQLATRGCMWILMGQLYGQMATIDLVDEWERLKIALLTKEINQTEENHAQGIYL